jgi:hypothetical protein
MHKNRRKIWHSLAAGETGRLLPMMMTHRHDDHDAGETMIGA